MAERVIEPTVGRIVWYRYPGTVKPLAAIVTYVHSSKEVNLCVFSSMGTTIPKSHIELVQPGEPKPEDKPFCCWMPYQVTKGYGSESGEKAAGTVDGPS